MTDLTLLPEFGKALTTLLMGQFVWEEFGSEGATRAAWGAPGIQPSYHREAVIVPPGPQMGCFVLHRLRRTMWLSLLRGAEQADTT